MSDIFADKKSTFHSQLNIQNTEVKSPDNNTVQTSFSSSNIQQQNHSEITLASNFSNNLYIGQPNNNEQVNLPPLQEVNRADNNSASVPLFSNASFSSVSSVPAFPITTDAAAPPLAVKPETNNSQSVPLFPPSNSGTILAPNPPNSATSKYVYIYILTESAKTFQLWL